MFVLPNELTFIALVKRCNNKIVFLKKLQQSFV